MKLKYELIEEIEKRYAARKAALKEHKRTLSNTLEWVETQFGENSCQRITEIRRVQRAHQHKDIVMIVETECDSHGTSDYHYFNCKDCGARIECVLENTEEYNVVAVYNDTDHPVTVLINGDEHTINPQRSQDIL